MIRRGDHEERREITSVEEWAVDLGARLATMISSSSRVVSVAQFDDGRYVQFWVESDGVVIAEVISNLYTGADLALTRTDEEALRQMGWHEPRRGPNPNWHLGARGPSEIAALVELVRRVVRDVLGERGANRVSVHSWTIERDVASLDELREESRVHYRRSLERIRRELDES